MKFLRNGGIIYLKNVDNSTDNDYHYRIVTLSRRTPHTSRINMMENGKSINGLPFTIMTSNFGYSIHIYFIKGELIEWNFELKKIH